MQTILKDPPLLRQPDGITCGASTLAMAAALLLNEQGKKLGLTVSEVGEMIGTNTRTGTTHENMAIGMRAFGLSNKRSTSDNKAVDQIWTHVNKGAVVALRTLTCGFPHWILAYKTDGNSMLINDPAQGKIKRSRAQVNELIKPRDWEFWPIDREQKVRDLQVRCLGDLSDLDKNKVLSSFDNSIDPTDLSFIGSSSRTNWNLSWGLFVNDQLVGIHLLTENIQNKTVIKEQGTNGIESLALFVQDKFRNCGYGRLLNAVACKQPFDYILLKQVQTENGQKDVVKRLSQVRYRMPDAETIAQYERP